MMTRIACCLTILLACFGTASAQGNKTEEKKTEERPGGVPLEKWDCTAVEKEFDVKLKNVRRTNTNAYTLLFEFEKAIDPAKVAELRRMVGVTPSPFRVVVKDADNVIIGSGSFTSTSSITGEKGDAFRASLTLTMESTRTGDVPASVIVRRNAPPAKSVEKLN